jgi:NADH dehydrogenase
MIKSYDGSIAYFDKIDPIATKSLIWGAGVKGNPIEGMNKSVYAPSGRILVNEYNQTKEHSNIYVIGDLASMPSENFPKGHPMLAPTAIGQAKQLAENLKNSFHNKPMKPYRHSNKGSMATIGRNLAVAEIKSAKFYGRFAWFIWIFVHLMSLVSFRNKVTTFFSWMISYFSYDKSNRYIIGKNFGANAPSDTAES